jgi:long-chain acyl-CoA synthetase
VSVRDVLAERREIDAAVAGQTVCSLFQSTAARHADGEALRWKEGDQWRSTRWSEYATQVHDLANGLLALGLEPGEFVTILSANRPEHVIADLGILHAGGVPVSLYNTLAPEQIDYIANDCRAGFAVVENRAFYGTLRSIRERLPLVQKVILVEGGEGLEGDDWAIALSEVMEMGRRHGVDDPGGFERRWREVKPDDLATLIYTSGTTGPPKGVKITHANVCWTAESLYRVWPGRRGLEHISYLPLAHIAERMVGHYLQMKGATTCHFCPNPQEIGRYLLEVRPRLFFGVPRVWEKLHAGLTSAIAAIGDESQRSFLELAIATGLEKVRTEQAQQPVPPDLEERAWNAAVITRMLRERAGLDRLEIVTSGAAPIALEVLEWFHAIGVPIAEIYGQSEGTGPTSWNRPGAIRLGTVGQSIPGVEVRLAEDGELLVRGGNVSPGYHEAPDLTRETFDADGWLHSGDVAVIDDEGYVRIVDRKKEILITAGGKNIAPSNLESLLKQKPLVGQACVIGDRRPFLSALVVLDPETVRPWARARGLPSDAAALAREPQVLAEIQSYVDEINRHVANVERIKKVTVLPAEWTIESGELTPTLKMRRKVVNEKYSDAIESMYR